jgi:hypothetical protein
MLIFLCNTVEHDLYHSDNSKQIHPQFLKYIDQVQQ